jgi:SAM-dependent methyltransferase
MSLRHKLLAHPAVYGAFHRIFSGEKVRELGLLLDTLPKGRALDLGCGPGTSAPEFLRRGWQYLGVDSESAYVEFARSRWSGRFLCADATRLGDLGESFELVLVNSVLHHLDDRGAQAILAAAAERLCPEGRVVVMDLVVPEGWGAGALVGRALVRLDRGDWPRPAAALETLLLSQFAEVSGRPYTLALGPLALWEMRLYVCRRPRSG